MPAERVDQVLSLLRPSCGNTLLYVIHYGSRSEDADLDMLVVYKHSLGRADFVVGQLDLFVLGEAQLHSALQQHDPLVSEPLLTGDLIHGDKEQWARLQTDFRDKPPTTESVFSIRLKAMFLADQAAGHLDSHVQQPSAEAARQFWHDLGFAVSYAGFAEEYARGNFPITFHQLVARDELLAACLQHGKCLQSGGTGWDPDRMRQHSLLAKARFADLGGNAPPRKRGLLGGVE